MSAFPAKDFYLLTIKYTLFFFLYFPFIAISQVNVLSFNIRYDTPKDGINQWSNRKEKVAQVIEFHEADIVGLQEVLKSQLDDLATFLPAYTWIGVGRDDGKEAGEYSPILFQKERFKLLKQGTFWLSETCDIAGSRGWDAACNRVVTWGYFKDKKQRKKFYFFNTHFDHRGVIAKRASAELILQKITEIAGQNAFVLTGDFNGDPKSEPYAILTKKGNAVGLQDAFFRSRTGHYGQQSTFSGFKVPREDDLRRIDYIFVPKRMTVLKHAILTDSWGGLFPSDHFPVLARLKW